MLFVFLFLLWIVSPIVFLILFLVQVGKTSELKRQNKELSDRISELMKGTAQVIPEDTLQAETTAEMSPEREAFAKEKNVQLVQKTQPYDLPVYSAAAVKPAPAESEQSVPETAVPKSEKAEKPRSGSVSTINIILILGALLISLSGFIFAAAAWEMLNSVLRMAVLVSFSAVFFGIHSLAERKLKLAQTGRIFYILGSVFLPAAIVAAGVLEVFGEYFSFTGDGAAAVLSAVFLSVCIPFFKGAHDYKNRFFASVSYFSFSASAVALMWQLSPRKDVTALCMAVFALAVTVTEPLAEKLLARLFGEKSVFVPEWSRFAAANAWALSIISVFLSESGFVSLAAFAVFSACFLTKTVTGKSSAAGGISFAFFIALSLFTGFAPDEISGVTLIIAAVSLIYAVLSAMGIFPETLKKVMRVLALIAAGIAVLLGLIENVFIIAGDKTPTLQIIAASAAVYAQLLIFALRNKTAEYKAMSFGAMLWLSADVMLLIAEKTEMGYYAFAAAYGIMLVYFAAIRFTKLRNALYISANDVILAVYAVICASACCMGDGLTGGLLGLAIIASAIIVSALSGSGKISAALCPTLTFFTVIPFASIFAWLDASPISGNPDIDAFSAALILMCIIAAVLLFTGGKGLHTKAYGIGVLTFTALFTVISISDGTFDFVPLAAVTAYTAVYLFRYALPEKKYAHVDFLYTAITLTALFVGGYCTDSAYMLCFPSAALMLIFAVLVIGESMGGFEKTFRPSAYFLFGAMPLLSGLLLIVGNNESIMLLTVFGGVLGVCALFPCIFLGNILPQIFPLFTASAILASGDNPVPAAIFAAAIAVLGHIMFRQRLWGKLYSDIFSIGAFLPALAFLSNSDTDLKRWIGVILLALLTLNLVRKDNSQTAKRGIATAAAAFIFPIWWVQPFFEIPEFIVLEFNLLPVVIFCVFLRLMWRGSEKAVDGFAFWSASVSLVILFIGALMSGDAFDAVFIGIVLLIMLAVSFIIKKKRWFVLAVSSMAVSAVLLSIGQRDSIAWLVYLALTGAALIALGVVNELKKQQKRSGEETKLTRFMSDWTW